MHPAKPKLTFRQKVGILIITGSTRSEEHTSELQSRVDISYAVF